MDNEGLKIMNSPIFYIIPLAKYILLLAIYLEDTLNTTLTCIVLVSEKHCSMFNANKLLYCIVLYFLMN